MNTLFINACVRKDSRTLALAESILRDLQEPEQNIIRLNLSCEPIQPLNRETLAAREAMCRAGQFDDPMFRYAGQFAVADRILIAAPFWDLSFPSLLKIYMEAVTVAGITFRYSEEGRPVGLCRAKELIYATTAGGKITEDFGYSYIRTMAKIFYGIPETVSYRAEMLDVMGITAENVPAGVTITKVQ